MAALRRELDGRPAIAIGLIVGALGVIGTVLGFVIEPVRGFAAYLAAWCAVAFVAAGGLAVLLIGYAANARWPAVVRRMSEAVASGLVPVAILMIPLLVWCGYVWPWVSDRQDHAVQVKDTYLSVWFFVIRAIVYFTVMIIPAEILIRWSRRRDDNPDPPVPHGVDALNRERRLASAMLPVVGLALTFAAFDWLMSLQPDWWSTGFGLYVITAALEAGLAMVVVLAWRGVASGAVPLMPSHFHALGRLLHAFVILWMYIAYFQAMLITIANIPSEAKFYVVRNLDGWRVVTALLVITKFVFPFVLLFSRRMKHRPRYVAGIAILLLFGHYLDMWWLVVPRVSSAPIPSWTDLSSICAIGGLTTAYCAWRLRGVPLLPVGDPYLPDGLAYRTKV